MSYIKDFLRRTHTMELLNNAWLSFIECVQISKLKTIINNFEKCGFLHLLYIEFQKNPIKSKWTESVIA